MSKTQKNEFNISGKVIFVGMPINITERLNKRLLVLEVFDNRYRQEVPIEYMNDNMSQLDNIREHDWVNVDFVLRGRRRIQQDGTTRWFPTIEGKAVTLED